MENKTIKSIAFIVLSILTSVVRHFVDNGILKNVLVFFFLIIMVACFMKDMDKTTKIALKGIFLSALIVIISGILANLEIISLSTLAVIVCISLLLALTLIVIQWCVIVKNRFK